MPIVVHRASRRRVSLAVAALLVGLTGAATLAGSLDVAIPIALSAQPLGEALRALAKEANLQILFDADLVAGRSAPPIRDTVSPRAALARLLRGTDLEAHELAPGVVVIRSRDEAHTKANPAAANATT